jgi:O-antigen/teichoic acid export membrane protein
MAAFYIFQFSLASSIVSLTNIPNSAAIVAHEDMGVYAVFSIVDAVLRVTFVGLLFVVSCDKLLFYAGALLVIQIVSRLISEVWCRLRYEECCLSRNFDWGVMRSMLGISGWSGLSNISYTIFIQGVNLLINLFFGPVMNAAYGVAMQVYSGIRSFTSSFQLASNPQIVKLYSVGETDRMCRLVFSTCRMSFYLIFCLSLPFLINAHYVLDLWLDEVPTHTESFFRLFLFYAYIDVLAYPLNVAAQATGILGRYTTLTSIAVLAILPIAYVCYCCGAVAEVVYVIAIIVSVLSLFIRIFCLNRIMGFPVMAFVREVLFRMLCVVALASILPLLNHCLTTTTTLWNVIINFIIAFISGCTVVYIVGLNQQEQNFLRGYFLRLIQKFRKL